VNRERLQEAVAEGMHVAIASGRMTPRIEPVAELLGLDPVIIAYNGGKVVAPMSEGRTLLHHRPVPAAVAETMIRFSRDNGYLLNFYHEDKLYAEDGGRRQQFMEVYSRRTGAEYNIESDLSRFVGMEPTKLILLADPDECQRLHGKFSEELKGDAFVTKSDPEYLEIMAPGVDKGTSLGILAQHYGFTTDEVVAVGDANNDLELIQAAGLGVAVANATPELKAVADVLTERTNNEGAVAEVVERWFLGGDA